MTEVLLSCIDFTNEQEIRLKNQFPNIKIIMLDNLTEQNKQDITIIYGWSQTFFELDQFSSLKWIQTLSAGVNYLPIETLKNKNIIVTTTSGIHGHQMTESVLGMLFSYTRNIRESILKQEKREWGISSKGTDLVGKHVLIFGTGSIAQQLAKTLNVFGCNVFGINRSGRDVEEFTQTYTFEEGKKILDTMDIVINLMPGTAETDHYFADSLFSNMKDQVIFINMGRGSSVDTNSLIKYAKSGKIGFAALDVFEEEPLPKESELWGLKNVLITPHISGATDKYNERAFAILTQNILSFTKKQPLKNRVDLELGY